jgi:hypothetical protein
MMTPKKERAIQSTMLLMLITTILLSFLCVNAFSADQAKRNTVPANGGRQLTSLALVNKINRFIMFDYNHHITQGTAMEKGVSGYSAQTVNDGNFGVLLRSFRVR